MRWVGRAWGGGRCISRLACKDWLHVVLQGWARAQPTLCPASCWACPQPWPGRQPPIFLCSGPSRALGPGAAAGWEE